MNNLFNLSIMNVELAGGTLAITLVVIFAALVGLIFFMKSVYNKRTEKALQGDYKEAANKDGSYIANRAKYEPARCLRP